MTFPLVVRSFAVIFLSFFLSSKSLCGSLYLPLKLSTEIENRVEQLFVLADMPIIKRPIPIKQVQIALDKVGSKHPAISQSVSRYLNRFSSRIGLTHFGISASSADGAEYQTFNGRGQSAFSDYDVAISGYWALSDSVLVNIGGLAYEGNVDEKDEFLEGSFVSIGSDYLQLDIGNRPHWFGPFQDSDMLISTQAPAIPSVTISNVIPFSFLGFSYEIFLGEMSESEFIQSETTGEFLAGNPRLFGLHLGFNPFTGFAIGFNRLMQYGGGDRDESFSGLLEAFANAKQNDNVGNEGRDFGNQLSSITTRYTFADGFPFSVYMEYAGEDTSHSSSFHLGNTALMLGIHLPKLTDTLDLVIEHAEWQNDWYVNSNYGDGLSQYDNVIGHWGATQRQGATGAKSLSTRLSWAVADGKDLQFNYRELKNTDDTETGQFLSISYATDYRLFIVGAEMIYGQDIFGEEVTRIEGFFRW